MRLNFLKKHLMKHSRNSVSKSVDSKFSGRRSEGDVCAPPHPPPPPPPTRSRPRWSQICAKSLAITLQDLMKHSEISVFDLPHVKLFWEGGVREACPRSPHWLAPSVIADWSFFTFIYTKCLEKALPWTIKTSRTSLRFFFMPSELSYKTIAKN